MLGGLGFTMPRSAKASSEKSFGLTFAVVFAIIGLWPVVFHGSSPYVWALALTAVFAAAAFLAPKVLSPLNRLWFRFGMALHHIVNPLVMAVLYYGAVVPMGLLLRATGKDLLRLSDDRSAASYWVRRNPPGPAPDSMPKQF
jgi:predicted membrane metal-binding protein